MLSLTTSSLVLGSRVASVSTLVPLNVAITLDPGLAKKMVDFIVQPHDQ